MFGFAALLIASFAAIILVAHLIEAYRSRWARFQLHHRSIRVFTRLYLCVFYEPRQRL